MDGDLDGIDGMAWMPFMSLRFWPLPLVFLEWVEHLTTLGTGEPITMSVAAAMGVDIPLPTSSRN